MEKRIRMTADLRAREYRKLKAYVRGVEDAAEGEVLPTEKYLYARRWIWAVEAVERRLSATHADKHAFFVQYYGLRMPRFGHTDNAALMHLCDKLHVSRSTLCAWRKEIQLMLVVAGTQAGAVKPY